MSRVRLFENARRSKSRNLSEPEADMSDEINSNDGNKKLGLGMAIGVGVGMILYKLIFG